jgi:hypothetical protein
MLKKNGVANNSVENYIDMSFPIGAVICVPTFLPRKLCSLIIMFSPPPPLSGELLTATVARMWGLVVVATGSQSILESSRLWGDTDSAAYFAIEPAVPLGYLDSTTPLLQYLYECALFLPFS